MDDGFRGFFRIVLGTDCKGVTVLTGKDEVSCRESCYYGNGQRESCESNHFKKYLGELELDMGRG